MFIQPINYTNFTGSIYGNLDKGRKAFNALTPTEQAIKTGIEMFRQRYNRIGRCQLPASDRDLSGYIRYRAMISRVINNIFNRK